MTVQELIDRLLGYLDSGKVYLDSPVVVKLGDRTYEADVTDAGSRLHIALGAQTPDAAPTAGRR